MRFDERFHYKNGVTFRCRTCNRYIDRCRCNETGVWRKANVPELVGKTARIVIQMASGERRLYHRSAFPERLHAPKVLGTYDTNFRSKGEFMCSEEIEFFEIYEEVVADPDERLFRYVLTSKQRAALVSELRAVTQNYRVTPGKRGSDQHLQASELLRMFAEGGEDVKPEDVL